MKIIGLNAVADTVRALRADYNGLAIYDKETQTIRFEGALKNSCSVSVEVNESEVYVWLSNTVTERDIEKMVARIVDYDAYEEMVLADEHDVHLEQGGTEVVEGCYDLDCEEAKVIRILDEDEFPEHGIFMTLDDGSIAEVIPNVGTDIYAADCCERGWIDDITRFSFYTLGEMSEAGLTPFESYDEEDAAEWGYDSVEDISIQICPLCRRAIWKHRQNKRGSN